MSRTVHAGCTTKDGSDRTSTGMLSMAEVDRRCAALIERERQAGRAPEQTMKVRRVDPSTLRGKA